MKFTNRYNIAQLIVAFVISLISFNYVVGANTNRMPAAFVEKKFTINVHQSDLTDLLRVLAKRGEMDIYLASDLKGKASYNFNQITIDEAMKRIAQDHKLDYSIRGRSIYISQIGKGKVTTSSAIKILRVRFTDAKSLLQKMNVLLKTEATIVVDEKTNSLIYYGGDTEFGRVKDFVNLFDTLPRQILIDALVVETSKSFLRDLGVAFGQTENISDFSSSSTTTATTTATATQDKIGFLSDTPRPATPNLFIDYTIGTLDSKVLAVQLRAAESDGQAKIVSRPKVVTLNQKVAKINSGVTYNVKTLTTTASTSTEVASGVTQISAGLQLDVTPSVIDLGLVRLDIKINNSEPDLGVAVDGIPGVVNNSAETSVIVANGKTATIAGLVKKSKSETRQGVPILKDIPILGFLFSSKSETDNDSELVIFITPTVLARPVGTTFSQEEMRGKGFDPSTSSWKEFDKTKKQ